MSKLGVKAGLNFSGITAPNTGNTFGEFSPPMFSLLSPDFGIYAEMFNKERYCVSFELHYVTKGENPNYKVQVPLNPSRGEIYNFKNASDRFQYISLQVLPRYRFGLTEEDKIYFLLGPHLDYRISNHYSDNDNEYALTNSKLELGFTGGVGGEVRDIVNFEFRFAYNLTNLYKVSYGSTTVSRNNISISFVAGVCLKNYTSKKRKYKY